ncbi:MAG: HAD hydrolase-like protein [Atopobiaceae bacterium]|jgi:phosphoglycolate phosphatase|nr:HAD hydrolase-like protein [Atopobiaceae bacterium]MCH4119506.1 HAD hydrolase-like protein [Atopobiaceae bacterium]MCI1389609.1 HAD hydrolase-like protein [Atopobiaceae bacterium]MCI1431673.1 HAD hydrolase-like protein [Atopobiaceae bacterium]MCI1470109.1 HAD hydrolase-like protein [Atopobiaceae bacterium]
MQDDSATRRLICSLPSRDHILLDFDGTLGDTAEVVARPAVLAMRELGMTDEEIGDGTRLVGPPWPAGFMDIYGMDMETATKVSKRAREIRKTTDQSAFPLFEGVPEFLEALRDAGRTLVLVTSRETDYAARTAHAKGIDGYFDAVIGQDDQTQPGKVPLVGKAFERYGVGPERCVFVGDRRYDVEAGKAWGVPTVGCLWGIGGREELEEAGADLLVSSFAELQGLLLGGGGGSCQKG